MMNYNNGFVPSYMNPQQQMSNLINQYPQFFNPALQQAVANPNTNIQAQNSTPTHTSQNNTITTQPPIMQPQNSLRNDTKILYVGNKEEATATPIDLVYNTPTFFFNRGANQVYMKQYDSTTGNAIFKTFVELEPTDEPINENKSVLDINTYQEEFDVIKGQINDLQKTFDNYIQSQSQNNKDKGNSKANEKRS